MIEKQTEARWSENVIIVDAAYIDKVAFNLIVNFERIIGRRIPNADLARWIDCVALDGGIREGEHETSVVLVHAKDKSKLAYFTPADIAAAIASKAFKDHLGEFIFTPVTPADMATEASLVKDTFALIRSAITSVLTFPIVLSSAGSCLFLLVTSITSESARIKEPTPARHSISAAKAPTPPSPIIATHAFSSFCTPALPTCNSVLSLQSSINSLILNRQTN